MRRYPLTLTTTRHIWLLSAALTYHYHSTFGPISIKWIVPRYWSQMVSVYRPRCVRPPVALTQTSPETGNERAFSHLIERIRSRDSPLLVFRQAPPSVSTVVCLATHLAFVGSEMWSRCLRWSTGIRLSCVRWKRSTEKCQNRIVSALSRWPPWPTHATYSDT